MELKKSSSASNENLRIPIMLMGLLFVGGILLASFTYEVAVKSEGKVAIESGKDNSTVLMEEEQEEPEETVEEPEVEAVEPPQDEIIEEENTDEEPVADVPVPPPAPPAPEVAPLPVAEIIDFPDVEAEFPGGAAELQRWISANVEYPEIAIEMEDQGRVFLSFVVETDGSITNIEVTKGRTKELDREAKRVVRKMPKWSAGESSGKKVRTRCQLPIVFTLE